MSNLIRKMCSQEALGFRRRWEGSGKSPWLSPSAHQVADVLTEDHIHSYYEFGPEDGEKVMLVHGITTPTPVWKAIAPQLAEAGYRVLTYVSSTRCGFAKHR